MGIHAKVTVDLKASEIEQLRALSRKGVHSARVVQRARCLLLMSEGASAGQAGKILGLTAQAARDIVKRYRADGLAGQLQDRPRPGAESRLDAGQQQRIIAMICSDPPEGASRWTVRLITAEAIRRKLAPSVGRETIRLLLEHHDLKPWREKNVVRRRTR